MEEIDKSQKVRRNLFIDRKILLICNNCNNKEEFYYKTTLSENKERGMVFLDGSMVLCPQCESNNLKQLTGEEK